MAFFLAKPGPLSKPTILLNGFFFGGGEESLDLTRTYFYYNFILILVEQLISVCGTSISCCNNKTSFNVIHLTSFSTNYYNKYVINYALQRRKLFSFSCPNCII